MWRLNKGTVSLERWLVAWLLHWGLWCQTGANRPGSLVTESDRKEKEADTGGCLAPGGIYSQLSASMCSTSVDSSHLEVLKACTYIRYYRLPMPCPAPPCNAII